MTADYQATIRLERREHTRASDQRRQVQRGDVVRFAACTCLDGDHRKPDRIAWVPDIWAAYEDGVGALGELGGFHLIRRETKRVDL